MTIALLDLANLMIDLSGLVLAILGLLLSWSLRINSRPERRYFIVLFAILTVYAAAEFINSVSFALLGADYALFSRVTLFVFSLASSMLMPWIAAFLLSLSGAEPKKSPVFYLVVALWVLYCIVLLWAQFTDAIYYVTDTNIYRRGPLYPFLLIPAVLLMLVNLAVFLLRREKLSPREQRGFAIYLLLPLSAMLFQMFFYGIQVIALATTIAALFLFVELLHLQTDTITQQRDENTRQQVDILMAQIQPHFIYNTLSSAYYLCDTDPRKAQMTIGSFTTYLRKNFGAIASRELIPFTEELEHTRAYLAVEKMRYEDLLSVSYDIPHIAFSLPALTLEPIVENAVKHSVDPESETVHILIRTVQTKQGSAILVEDDGPGFVPAADEKPHIGLSNVENRLRLMCGGTLRIDPRDGGGTVVTILVPDGGLDD